MTVRYQRPAQPGEVVLVEAELVTNRRGRLFEAKAELRNAAGEIVASATGKYMPVQEANLGELQRDAVGDLGWLLGSAKA
jgi:acyl-coenzyme A thioesterase PaaI-like protein